MQFVLSTTLLSTVLISCTVGFSVNPDNIRNVIRNLQNKRTIKDASPLDDMTTPEIIRYWGYPAEIYHTTTDDGYILELHRIPYGINGSAGENRPVALLQHGLFSSSSDWITDKPDRAFAYMMADAGYDVWMNNVRGNTYSRNHTTLDPEKTEFWQWTWHESAVYDIPAALDFALAMTGQTQVYYVGFSMGTTMFFALMSDRNEYADKITVAALMGPVAYTAHVKGLFRLVSNYSERLDTILTLTGHSELFPSTNATDYIAENFCGVDDATLPICEYFLFLMCGFDPEQLNTEYLSIFMSHTPAGSSVHTANHYEQLIPKATFQNYDWGTVGNINHYGSDNVPFYNLSVNTPPIGLYWGPNDWLATPEDLVTTASELRNVVVNHRVEWDTWNHIDFIWGINAKEYVYDYVVSFLSQY